MRPQFPDLVETLDSVSANHSLTSPRYKIGTNPMLEDRIWYPNEGDCRSCHHEVIAQLKEFFLTTLTFAYHMLQVRRIYLHNHPLRRSRTRDGYICSYDTETRLCHMAVALCTNKNKGPSYFFTQCKHDVILLDMLDFSFLNFC